MMLNTIKDRNRVKRLLWVLFAAVILMAVPTDAWAAKRVDIHKDTQLTIAYGYGGQPLPGAGFRLYRTADMTVSGSYVLTGGFEDCPVDLRGLDAAGWMAAANTMDIYAAAHKLEPQRAEATDSQGMLCYDGLTAGLYLVKADDLTIDSTTYRSAPFLVSLPSLGEDDIWDYAPQVSPKTTTEETGPGTELTVVKVWNDGASHIYRPQEITVILLRDGEEYSRATLSSGTYWRHTWKGLENGHVWKIIEESVPSPYTVTYTEEGSVYTVTNSTEKTGGGGGGGGGGGRRYNTPPAEVNIPEEDVPRSNIEIPEEDVPKSGLPQTGLLWWPVPFLSMAGLLLLGMGYKEYYSGKRKDNEE
ncbi:Cna B-type domain-containing protein [Enterocloster bolteae]|jgi:hypothetical protein|uniref:Cna B-type domain-containing protein n=1 Tax=Clostridia TaxID=186801 RepID=UPI00189FBB83|nr:MULTISPECIES: Cna B-type domain-containing protein [Clostridia]MCB7091721.1 Cna B-type domain-containing protein [Enterocloster bolteae]MCH1938691.1 Cna B-type domain-containing protein [Enterocloster sp. OA11]